MGKLLYLNEMSQSFHERVVQGPKTYEETWTSIERVSRHPSLVAIAQSESGDQLELVDEGDLMEISHLGKAAIHERVRWQQGMWPADFEVAVAMCEEAIREQSGSDEYVPVQYVNEVE